MLSKWNLIFAGIIVIISFCLFLISSERSDYEIGNFTGKILLRFLLYPLLAALIVWFISGKRKKSSRLAFHAVLFLMIFISIGRTGKDIRHTRELKDLQAAKDELKQELLATPEDPEKVNTQVDDYQTKVRTTFDKFAEESTGREAEFYRTIAVIFGEVKTRDDKWEASLDAIQAPEVLDFSLLKSQDEMNDQKEIVAVYVSESEKYKEYFVDFMDHMKKMLEPIGLETDFCKGALEGAKEKHDAQIPLMIPLMDTHIAYGKAMMEILRLLEKDPNGWSFESGKLNFDSEENLERFDDITLRMIDLEEKIETLREKLVEVY